MSDDIQIRPEPQTDAEFQSRDRDDSDDDIRRAAADARTEDQYLDALREAGSLSAGLAVVNHYQAQPSQTLGLAGARRYAEDALRDARLYGTPFDVAAASLRLKAARAAERAYAQESA
jgi:hypothetical protein